MNTTATLGFMNFHDIVNYFQEMQKECLDGFFYPRRQEKWREMGDLQCDLFSCNFICTFQWKPACPSTFTRNAYIRLPLESGTSIFLA